MFLTIAYSVACALKEIYRQCRTMFYLRMIHKCMSDYSIILHKTVKSTTDLRSLSSQSSARIITHSTSDFHLSVVEPQVALFLDGWLCHSLPQHNCVSFLMRLVRCTDVDQSNHKLTPMNIKGKKIYSLDAFQAYQKMQGMYNPAFAAVRVMDKVNLTQNGVYASLVNKLPQDDNSQYRSTSLSSNSSSCMDSEQVVSKFSQELVSKLLSESSINDDSRRPNKPPNVLVYCGKKDSTRLFENIKAVICECINTSCYTVYHLKHEQVMTTPWSSNTALLVIASDKVYDGVDRRFLDYFLHGGAVMSFGSCFDWLMVHRKDRAPEVKVLGVMMLRCSEADDEQLAAICTRYSYDLSKTLLPNIKVTSIATERNSGEPVVVEARLDGGDGIAILSQVNLEKDPVEMAISNEVFRMLKRSNASRFKVLSSLFTRVGLDCSKSEVPALTAVHLLAKSKTMKNSFLDSLEPRLTGRNLVSRELTLQFVSGEGYKSLAVTPTQIPVVTDSVALSQNATGFDFDRYCQHHSASVLGNTVLFADVINTTMTLFDGLMFSCPVNVGLVAVARRQVAGQGRGGNTWLSPDGCAMFSVHVRIPLESTLGERVAFIQHLMGLAVVLAVRQKSGCESVDLRIKWPNDIYYGRDVKLGGIIVRSTVMNGVIHVNIGCGVNVTNKDPTTCINDLLSRVSSRHENLSVEEFIARALNALEMLITEFQTQGRDSFLEKYYKYWLHSGASVRLGSDSGPEASIVGLDDYGFLLVRLHSDGSTLSVQPDGNSFDMMRNLIVPKTT